MIKNIDSTIKIVMVTKSEEEHLMEQAIGSQISDYILKPVNPNQILLSLKEIFRAKILWNKRPYWNTSRN
jgi:YesN/AraC family two-component response regulator